MDTARAMGAILVVGAAYLAGCRVALRALPSPALRRALLVLCGCKAAVALTMGHLDVTRFIVFLQQAVAAGGHDPWTYAAGHPEADFPYPPVLLYTHAAAFYLSRAWLPHAPPFAPVPLAYVLVRLPLLGADVLTLHALVRWGAAAGAPLRLYLLSPVILFHQFYSGQLDLVAACPLLLAWSAGVACAGRWRRWLLVVVSFCLKPFAVLYAPGLVLAERTWWRRLCTAAALAAAFCIYRLSELPWSLSPAYRQQMGAGAALLAGHGALFAVPLFAPCFAASLWLFARCLPTIARPLRGPSVVRLVTLGVAGLCEHSAGWMTWAGLAVCATAAVRRLSTAERRLLALWHVLFVARWTLVSHSPVFYSAGVALRSFVDPHHVPRMGHAFGAIAAAYGQPVAQAAEQTAAVAFALCSLTLAAVGLAADLAGGHAVSATAIRPPARTVQATTSRSRGTDAVSTLAWVATEPARAPSRRH